MKTRFLETDKIKEFTKQCLNNESFSDFKGSINIIKGYWEKAQDIEEFKTMIFNDERLNNNQGYWELAKEDKNTYKEMVENWLDNKADDSFTTISDIGSLAIGNDDFRYNIPNLYGDGVNLVYIFNTKVNIQCMDFLTTIQGKFNIYSYDLGNASAKKLEGRYAIYRTGQIFTFVKWN